MRPSVFVWVFDHRAFPFLGLVVLLTWPSYSGIDPPEILDAA